MSGNRFSPPGPVLGLTEDPVAAQAMGALNTVGIAAFLCDSQGRVRAMTPCAQRLLGEGRALELVGGRLHARSEGADLTGPIRHHANEVSDGATLLIPMEKGPALVLDITPLVREDWAARLPVSVLVTVRGRGALDARAEAALQSSFGLSPTEARIAIGLARGKQPPVIAAERQVSVQTIRTQIRNLYAKVGVGHRAALVAQVSALL